MSHRPILVLAMVLSPSLLIAQQVGSPNRNYTINGIGSLASSYVTQSLAAPGSMLSNSYATLDSNAPVVFAYAPTGTVGWFQTATNSVDLGPAGLFFMLNGTDLSNPLNLFAFTNAAGNFGLSINTAASLVGTSAYLAMAHVAASSPDGLWVSQTHLLTFTLDPNLSPALPACNPMGTSLVLADDSYSQQSFGFMFPFFGASYGDCYVGSNGYVTFNAGDTTFTESVSLFLSGSPRIAEYWDDFNPSVGGTVSFYTDNVGTWEVCFNNVPEFVTTGQNSFKVTGITGTAIILDYDASMGSNDGLVGLSPGGNLATGLPLNLSLGGSTIPAGMAPYELFTTVNDLKGLQVSFITDAVGTPIQQL